VISRRYKVVVCRGPECGERLGSRVIHAAFVEALRARALGAACELGWQSCFGRCRQGPNVLVRPILPGESRMLVAALPLGGPGSALYNGVAPCDALRIVDEHVLGGRVVRDLVKRPEEVLQPQDPTERKP
jgi:(2Fe-2S) ferredoxin